MLQQAYARFHKTTGYKKKYGNFLWIHCLYIYHIHCTFRKMFDCFKDQLTCMGFKIFKL